MNHDLFYLVNDLAGSYGWLDATMIFFAEYAEYLFMLALLVMFLLSAPHKKNVLYAGATAALALLISYLIGVVIELPRPFMVLEVNQLVEHAPDAAFPSDHSTAAFALAWGLWLRNKTWGTSLLVLAALIGLSRIFVGVHFPGDILGGFVVALIAAWAVRLLNARLEPLVNGVLRIIRVRQL